MASSSLSACTYVALGLGLGGVPLLQSGLLTGLCGPDLCGIHSVGESAHTHHPKGISAWIMAMVIIIKLVVIIIVPFAITTHTMQSGGL